MLVARTAFSPMTAILFVVAGFAALGDWVAVQRRLFRLEYLLKPLTLVLLIATAISTDLSSAKLWIVLGLIFGLLGDIGLMLSSDDAATPDLAFHLGLGAFLLGHICYVVGFLRIGVRGIDVAAGVLIAVGVAALALPAALRGAHRSGGADLTRVVALYAAVLALMTVLGVGTGIVATAIGAVLFLLSDTLIARERFVGPVRHGPLLVIVTYHLAQFLILLGLVLRY